MQQPYWRFLATEAGYGRHRAPPALVRRWKKQAREARDRARLVRQMFRPAKPGCYNTIHVVEHGGVFVRQFHTIGPVKTVLRSELELPPPVGGWSLNNITVTEA